MSKKSYWDEVRRIAEMALRDAAEEDGEVLVFVDEYVQDNGWLSRPQTVIAHSNNKDAFNEWEPGDVEEGSDAWWWARAFYAMTHDAYEILSR